MQLRTTKILTLLAAAGLAAPTAAHANGFKSWTVCGGSPVATCASASLQVSGTNVTLKVWNLSGNSAATYGASTYAGTIFNRIGIYNIPAAVNAIGVVGVSGPIRPGDGAVGPWTLQNNAPAGFASVDIVSAISMNLGGMASGCGAGLLPGANVSNPNFFLTPCGGITPAGAVTFAFNVNQNFNPATADLVFRGYDIRKNTVSTECHTGPYRDPRTGLVTAANCQVVPEPMTMALLGTGLAGVGVVGVMRRRKRNGDIG